MGGETAEHTRVSGAVVNAHDEPMAVHCLNLDHTNELGSLGMGLVAVINSSLAVCRDWAAVFNGSFAFANEEWHVD